ncbi:sodium-dependent transporter [Haematospirillum jordaniae]|uniref:Transporter n=1 Tax=Haematospirillum jordaniae TaxID=1549855 RepID=A0A143DD12_9PROT|nr:sodium-dependent transporter [Haematospirillum jordaniae]AMW34624.1 Na+-dependent transporter [Haematospirillum jordaniae]NKD44852.1 sodium-dependent transporter [Haematospirillum jordaniae]NKD57043.1 sodium-dependent transporter [Haematospirillum jordaniae]NKD58801.1 sodium-dependent transporter [Haematospirillum jordaniae]NKD66968.1 sodium-dependent transporter [Haematospirillum jordaniae]
MTREHWGSKLGFILAAAGSAVGLGNVWKFPYLVGQNGGAVFVITYLVLALTIGAALILAELALGRAAQKDPVGTFANLRGGAWSLAGYLGVLSGFLVLTFYSVIGGWTLAYVVKMVDGSLMETGLDLTGTFNGFVSNSVEPLIYHALFMLMTVLVVLRGIGSGIERCNKFLMPALFLILVFLAVRAVTLDGAAAGVDFYLRPDFSKFSGDTLVAALSQAFFSLSIGLGILITYGSYLDRSQNIQRSTLWIIVLDTGVGIFAGLIIMPAVFAFGIEPGAGPGLTFITLPGIFQQITGGVLFGTAFFVLLLFAALTSSVSLLEVPVAYLMDELQLSRKTAVLVLGGVAFLIGIPSSLSFGVMSDMTLFGMGFMDLLDYLTTKLMIPAGGMAVCIFAGWIVWPRMQTEVSNDGTLAFPLSTIWGWVLKVVAPASIAMIMVYGFLH